MTLFKGWKMVVNYIIYRDKKNVFKVVVVRQAYETSSGKPLKKILHDELHSSVQHLKKATLG